MIDGSFELEDRRVLITGAGRGVGAGVAEMLAAVGAEVLVNDLHAERAAVVVERIVSAGHRAESVVFDVTDHESVARAVNEAGPIDVLVNNAGNAGADGFGTIGSFVDSGPADWEPFLSVNVDGVLNCVHAVLPAMIDQGWGRIITVVSDSARSGSARLAVYGAAKAAAAGFTRGIAQEVARHGITVNNLALGTIRTEMTETFWADDANADQQARLLSGYPVRRPGTPDDVAWMVAALASPRAAWITAQTIPINGGHSAAL